MGRMGKACQWEVLVRLVVVLEDDGWRKGGDGEGWRQRERETSHW